MTRPRPLHDVVALVVLSAACTAAQAATPERPFADRSPWNSRPTKVVLAPDEVPKSKYFPTVAEGDYSVRVFAAARSDPAVEVLALPDKPGLYVADAETMVQSVRIPHWPSGVAPAAGTDGHADIVDVEANRIHSFYQLRLVDGQWRAAQYTWSALDGRGWGDPGHYFQGSRAAGVPTMAGIIRRGELDDGASTYRHALAMSLTFNALSPAPTYTYPATAADVNAAKLNHGTIPEGALMMLAPDFDVAAIRNPHLQKIVRTLQTYGAYVVDANDGTPFAFYVEIGSNFSLMPGGKWDNAIAAELDRIRAGLRRVASVGEWIDAKGVPFTPPRNLNLLSMRGPWSTSDAGPSGVYETWRQAVVFPAAERRIVQSNASGRSMQAVDWAVPEPGKMYRLTVVATRGASLRLDLLDASNRVVFSSRTLQGGQTEQFAWPKADLKPLLTIASGERGDGQVGATLFAVDEPATRAARATAIETPPGATVTGRGR